MVPENPIGPRPRGFSLSSLDITSLGELDDLLSLGSHDPGSPLLSRNVYNPPNAVHMEIQENAKLPTFNLSVDRTNSSRTRSAHLNLAPCTNQDLDEMIRLSETDVNLTEIFLKGNDRSSANMNWSSAGALLGHIGNTMNVDSSVQSALSPLQGEHRGISSPVPRAIHIHNESPLLNDHEGLMPLVSPAKAPVTTSAVPQYPSHRSLPLPIPKRLSPETTQVETLQHSPDQKTGEASSQDPLNAALATAAAIVTHSETGALSGARQSRAAQAVLPPSPALAAKRPALPSLGPASKQAAAQKSSQVKAPLPSIPLLLFSAAATPAKPTAGAIGQRSAAGANAPAPTASIIEATKRRSQFGFGGNHVVPSVPLPPPKPKAKRPRGSRVRAPPVPSVQQLSPSLGNNNSATVAYERKKQRAKDARVKLNDSIEHLSIAINLAGTQSRQRAEQLRPIPSDASSFRSNMFRLFEECAQISKDSKKWDRPSFVGSAASLVQTLNAQCEALFAELHEMKRQQGEPFSEASHANVQVGNGSRTLDAAASGGPQSSAQNGVTGYQPLASDMESPKRINLSFDEERHGVRLPTPKRPRVGDAQLKNDSHVWDGSMLNIAAMLCMEKSKRIIMSLLDYHSLLCCRKVSKQWQEFFGDEHVWLDLISSRFGYYNLRQWHEKILDEELPECSAIKLYQEMDVANVKPYSTHGGSLVLGEARMPGKVSAWISIVERSNGETVRSVLRESDKTTYTSLPVVELRLLIQNTGLSDYPIVVRDQVITVDASTRRRGEEMKELDWDDRFQKQVLNLDGSSRESPVQGTGALQELCRLKLYDTVILVAYIHARGCSTTSKFLSKSNFTKVLVTLNGTTVPLVVPFLRDSKKP